MFDTRQRSLLVLAFPLVVACGDGDGPAEPDAATDAVGDAAMDTDAADAADAAIPVAPAGTTAYFDLASATATGARETWFDFPFPSDLRLDPDGTLALWDPGPGTVPVINGLVAAAGELRGNSMVPVAWFRFDGPVAASDPEEVVSASVDAPALLVNVDPESPRYGELAPVVATVLGADSYVPGDVLAVAPVPGWVLDPSTTYAFVVRRSWADESGEALGVPAMLWAMAHGGSSGEVGIDANYAPLWTTLVSIGVGPETVAAATVFTTGDPVADVWELTEALRERYALSITDLAIDPDDGAEHERFCELHGTLVVPEFQTGEPPYSTGGLFVFGDDGLPVQQRETAIPVVVNLPLGEMPAEGFPLVMYFHGSGGLSTQVVDRGRDWAVGLGPAHVLARHGLATVGSAHPLNPERLPGATDYVYLNFANLASFRDTFRQGTIEQRLYLDALLGLSIDPAVVAGCDGLSLPDGVDGYFFDPEPIMAMGHSMGGMFTNIMTPVDPRIEAVVPSGAGGQWSHFILRTSLIPGVGGIISTLLDVDDLTHLHPSLHALQLAWEPVEAHVYVPRLAWDPLPGHPVRAVYEPVGDEDSYFPREVLDGMALAYRNQQAGEIVWPSLQTKLAWRGHDGIAEYPVVDNRRSADGTAYTGVVVQYPWDGERDGHNVFQNVDDAKRQYGCFFETFYRTGTATVPGPSPLDDPCPGL